MACSDLYVCEGGPIGTCTSERLNERKKNGEREEIERKKMRGEGEREGGEGGRRRGILERGKKRKKWGDVVSDFRPTLLKKGLTVLDFTCWFCGFATFNGGNYRASDQKNCLLNICTWKLVAQNQSFSRSRTENPSLVFLIEVIFVRFGLEFGGGGGSELF